ncbi:MAG: VWA domain-containing protein [Flavobacteriaceae bacterium]
MYRIEEPIYFYLLFGLLGLIGIFLGLLFWKKRVQGRFADLNLLQRIAPDYSTFKLTVKLSILLLGMAFLILGLTNPKMGTKLKTMKRAGVDVVFALDVSRSMDARDIAPSRLEKSKLLISRIIDQLGSDRVGIIIYAGTAHGLLPITTDHAAAKMFLEGASANMLSSQGTAISDALKMASTYYDNDEQTNRYLMILSDGEDHESNVTTAAENLVKDGVRIYTIGVGTEKGAPIPVVEYGNKVEYKRDKEGEVVITKRNDEVLRELAGIGEGDFYDGNNTSQTVEAFAEVIANAEKKEFETKEFSDYKDQFQWFLAIGLFFLIFDAFIYEKRTAWVKKMDLFKEKRAEL